MAPRLGKEKLTMRQRKLIKGIVAGHTVQKSALDAGYGNTPGSARVSAHRDLQNPNVQKGISDSLEQIGADIDSITKVIRDGQLANKKDKADHPTRLKAAELNGKFRGLLNAHQDAAHGPVVSIGFMVLKAEKERGIIHP